MTATEATATLDRSAESSTPTPGFDLLQRYRAVRGVSIWLCEPLSPEDMVVQSMTDASPAKWHLAHTTWFFEAVVLRSARPELGWYREEFNFLFNSYYNSLGELFTRSQRGLVTRPGVAETLAYREHVDEAMESFLESASEDEIERWGPVLEVGLNHEQQHQELLVTDLKHLLSFNPLAPVYRERPAVGEDVEVPELSWRRFAESLYWVGHDGDGFAYDNEGPRHQTFLQAFEIASRPVTCGEYLDFMAAGGYDEPLWWLSEGWATVQEAGWRAPLYWRQLDGDWLQYTLAGLRPVDPAEPVTHLSLYEADAYARWAGARLPTESEWEVAAAAEEPGRGNFVEDGLFHPRPTRPSDGAGMFGNGWEWTSSPYTPYPGYRPPAGALGEYNGKFMCNQHVLRGGSCATSRSHIRATYRNFFPAGARWQFTGFRLARDAT